MGIVAATAGNNIVPVLVEGLKGSEYRGYDSAGLAVISGDGIEAGALGRPCRRTRNRLGRHSVHLGIAHTHVGPPTASRQSATPTRTFRSIAVVVTTAS